ncbi:MAG: hypothetical protein E6K70_08530, partial [Planctomycetota bacterium]
MPGRILLTIAAIVICALQGQRSMAASPEEIKKAVEAGRDYLKRGQGADGSWLHEHRTGVTALATLALLECDVDSKDPVMTRAIAYLRSQVAQEDRTYELSL